MAKITTKETTVTRRNPGITEGQAQQQTISTQEAMEPHQTAMYTVYFILSVVEILLGFRLLLKLAGANPASGFVKFIYGFTQGLILPFLGIFRPATTQGVETTAVFEPATLMAMIVYTVVAWIFIQVVIIVSGRPEE